MTSKLFPTIFIGDVALDEYFHAERWPGPADKDFVTDAGRFIGGSIANAASVHAALGGRTEFGGQTEFVSLLNLGPMSDQLCAELVARGVSVRHMLRQDGIADARNLIFLTGEEHVVLTVDMGFQPMELGRALIEDLSRPGFLYTTLYRARRLNHAGRGGADLLADLRGQGRRAVFDLDVGGFAGADLGYLAGAGVLILNQKGYAASFGQTALPDLAGWMAAQGIGIVVRTRAEAGAEAFDGRTHVERAGYTVPVVDVTGAGDTFGAVLVHRLEEGEALSDALDLAVLASARAVTLQGPAAGMASMAELAAFRTRLTIGPGAGIRA